MFISVGWLSFMTKGFMIGLYSKMYPTLFANNHHGITTSWNMKI